ncbi:MAG: tol-pal system-associated acyl-CoA thioesterase [Pseudomonadota bacterium]
MSQDDLPPPPREFQWQVRVYYEDTDFSGVVYHARYLHFFERGRTEALRACGVHHSEMLTRSEPLAFTVRNMSIDWIIPARIDDILDVSTRFEEVRGARMLLTQLMHRGEDLISRAKVEAACMNLEGKPRRVPTEFVGRFTG